MINSDQILDTTIDPLHYKGFMGYAQKIDLLPVQKAILSYLLSKK